MHDPCIHKPNKDEDPSVNIPYSTLDTNNKNIARLTDSQLLGLKASIEKICEGYMSNEDKEAYD